MVSKNKTLCITKIKSVNGFQKIKNFVHDKILKKLKLLEKEKFYYKN